MRLSSPGCGGRFWGGAGGSLLGSPPPSAPCSSPALVLGRGVLLGVCSLARGGPAWLSAGPFTQYPSQLGLAKFGAAAHGRPARALLLLPRPVPLGGSACSGSSLPVWGRRGGAVPLRSGGCGPPFATHARPFPFLHPRASPRPLGRARARFNPLPWPRPPPIFYTDADGEGLLGKVRRGGGRSNASAPRSRRRLGALSLRPAPPLPPSPPCSFAGSACFCSFCRGRAAPGCRSGCLAWAASLPRLRLVAAAAASFRGAALSLGPRSVCRPWLADVRRQVVALASRRSSPAHGRFAVVRPPAVVPPRPPSFTLLLAQLAVATQGGRPHEIPRFAALHGLFSGAARAALARDSPRCRLGRALGRHCVLARLLPSHATLSWWWRRAGPARGEVPTAVGCSGSRCSGGRSAGA